VSKQGNPVSLPAGAKIFFTPNIVAFRQLGMWYDTKKSYLLVPSSSFGYVAVTLADGEQGDAPLYAFAVYRPSSIALSWDIAIDCEFVPMALVDATDWYNDKKSQFQSIGAPGGTDWERR